VDSGVEKSSLFPVLCYNLNHEIRSNLNQAGNVEIEQLRAARALLGWSQSDLAAKAGLSRPTIKRAETESDLPVSHEAKAKMKAALEAAGVEFINGDAPGVRLHRSEKRKK
jgi:DNA-binding XRE family transcriptional regulator